MHTLSRAPLEYITAHPASLYLHPVGTFAWRAAHSVPTQGQGEANGRTGVAGSLLVFVRACSCPARGLRRTWRRAAPDGWRPSSSRRAGTSPRQSPGARWLGIEMVKWWEWPVLVRADNHGVGGCHTWCEMMPSPSLSGGLKVIFRSQEPRLPESPISGSRNSSLQVPSIGRFTKSEPKSLPAAR